MVDFVLVLEPLFSSWWDTCVQNIVCRSNMTLDIILSGAYVENPLEPAAPAARSPPEGSEWGVNVPSDKSRSFCVYALSFRPPLCVHRGLRQQLVRRPLWRRAALPGHRKPGAHHHHLDHVRITLRLPSPSSSTFQSQQKSTDHLLLLCFIIISK